MVGATRIELATSRPPDVRATAALSPVNIYYNRHMKEQHKEEPNKKDKKAKETKQPKNFLEKLFGGINLTWTKLIISALVIGVLVGLIMCIPAIENTALTDIGVILYWWILFGVIIIMNSKSNLDSALKCFVFFLISQPVIYLVEVPFKEMGWGLFGYWRQTWMWWTLATFPMGFVGYWIKSQKFYSAIILAPALMLVAREGVSGFTDTLYLLRGFFCAAIVVALLLGTLRSWKLRGLSVAAAIIFGIIFTVIYAPKPEDYIFSLSFDVAKYGITTEKEWKVESDFGERATLEAEPAYDDEGNETGETFYYFKIRGNGYDFGTHSFKFIAPDEERNCTLEIVEKNISNQELICE